MLIAFNRVDAGGLAIDDVKDFFSSVKGGDELEIDDIMQVLNNHWSYIKLINQTTLSPTGISSFY